MDEYQWIKCPVCGENTRVKLMDDTELKHFPLFCRKCRTECIINVKQFKIEVLEKRKLENYGEVLAFNSLKPLFVFCAAVCSGMLGYIYFKELGGIISISPILCQKQ